MAQFDQPPPKQPIAERDEDISIEARQFNPPPPKQPLIDDEEPEFMAPKITEEGLYQVDDMITAAPRGGLTSKNFLSQNLSKFS